MKPSSFSSIFLLMVPILCALACSEPPVPSGSPTSAGDSTGGTAASSARGASSGSAVASSVGGTEEGVPHPEFRATRGAIQGVTEFSPESGKKLETACAAAEGGVAQGSGSRAAEQIHVMLTLLSAAQRDGLPGLKVSAVYSALGKDLGTLKSGLGTPKVVITETDDKLCAPDGRCTVESPGAVCYTAAFADLKPLCGCAEPAPPSVAVEKAAGLSEKAAEASEAVPEGDSAAGKPASAPQDEEATKK